MAGTTLDAIRVGRRLTAWLRDDLPVSRVLRNVLEEKGVDPVSCLLLGWQKLTENLHRGALVDESDRRFEFTFQWEPDRAEGAIGDWLEIEKPQSDSVFNWLEIVGAVREIRRIDSEQPADRDRRLIAAETELGIRFPEDYRDFMIEHDSWFGWTGGGSWLDLCAIDDLVGFNRIPQTETHPGFVAIGTDGSRELLGFDFRADSTPQVVMIQIASAGWEEAVVQAPNFSAFLDHLEHNPFAFE